MILFVTVAHLPAEISNSIKIQINQHFSVDYNCSIVLFTPLTCMSSDPHLYSKDF